MSNTSQLLLLADHVKLSLLERQRAISLNLEPNSHDGEISRSLDALQEGLEKLESQPAISQSSDTSRLRSQYSDLYSQFHGKAPPKPSLSEPNDPFLSKDFSAAASRSPTARSKSVRFTDNPSAEEDPNRAALLPYRDVPDDDAPDHSHLDNQQIHEYHSQVMRDQDGQLDQLGQSVGRQKHLSIQIGSELDNQNQMLEELDAGVDRHQTTLDKARGRLGKFARKAKDNKSLTVIFILIITLVLVIIILE